MTELDTSGAWLSFQELSSAREQPPILYVHAVPVRVDDRGEVIKIGLLLRPDAEGNIANEIVGGRVLYHERIRDALARHIETDLGPMALPRIPMAPQPFQVAEFFPTHGVTPFHDPRQHAVSLVYVVAVMGDCSPPQDSPPQTLSRWPPRANSPAATAHSCGKRWLSSATRSDPSFPLRGTRLLGKAYLSLGWQGPDIAGLRSPTRKEFSS